MKGDDPSAFSFNASLVRRLGIHVRGLSTRRSRSRRSRPKVSISTKCAAPTATKRTILQLKKVPPDLHAVFKSGTLPSGGPATDAAVRRVVLAGKGMMPAFNGRFDDAQMSALLAYLHTGLR